MRIFILRAEWLADIHASELLDFIDKSMVSFLDEEGRSVQDYFFLVRRLFNVHSKNCWVWEDVSLLLLEAAGRVPGILQDSRQQILPDALPLLKVMLVASPEISDQPPSLQWCDSLLRFITCSKSSIKLCSKFNGFQTWFLDLNLLHAHGNISDALARLNISYDLWYYSPDVLIRRRSKIWFSIILPCGSRQILAMFMKHHD